MEKLLEVESHEILLRAERNFFYKLLLIPVAVTQQIQLVLMPNLIDVLNFSWIMYDICLYDK